MALGILVLAALVTARPIVNAEDSIRTASDAEMQPAVKSRGIPIETLRKGVSSREEREVARRRIPLDRLAAHQRTRANFILKSPAIFRSLPVQQFEIDPDVYRFFVRHPDVAVSIWRVLKISRFEMWQTGPNEYEADTGDGSSGLIDIVYQDEHQCVVLCDGLYKSPLLPKPIKAHGLLHHMADHSSAPDGRRFITHRVSVFVNFSSQPVKTLATVISPVTNMILDRNLLEVSAFAQMMSLAVKRQPGWVETVATRMEEVLEPSRRELLKLTERSSRQPGRTLPSSPEAEPAELQRILEPLRATTPVECRSGALFRNPLHTSSLNPADAGGNDSLKE